MGEMKADSKLAKSLKDHGTTISFKVAKAAAEAVEKSAAD